MQRLEEFIRHGLNGVMDAEWFWYRFEYQARGSIHAHGCAKLKNDPDIRLLRNHACLAFLENETSRHEISPDDFEFLMPRYNKPWGRRGEVVNTVRSNYCLYTIY